MAMTERWGKGRQFAGTLPSDASWLSLVIQIGTFCRFKKMDFEQQGEEIMEQSNATALCSL